MGRIGLIFVVLLSLLGVYVQGNAGDTFYDDLDILDVPYIAAIYLTKNGEEHGFLCNGVILDPKTILTTASCLVGTSAYNTIVRVGSSFADRGGRQFKGFELSIHPKYDPDFDNDIAILRIYPEMVLSSRIAPVKLPEENSLLDGIVYGNYITWSFSTTLTVAKMGLNTMSNTSCSVSYQSSYPRKELFTDRMICTSPSRFLCSHGPGSPFLVNDILYGLYSWTYRCDHPAVFTRVSAFISWIDSVRSPIIETTMEPGD